MGFSSQSGAVILRTQADPGVFSPDIDTEGVSVRLRSGALAGNRDLLVLDPEIGGGRDTSDAYLGTVNFQGDYEMYSRFESIATILQAVLGESSSAPGAEAGSHVHTITPTDAQPPFLSVYERISSGLDLYRYTDVMVTSLSLEAEPNGYLMATASMLGREMTAGGTEIDHNPLYDLTPATVGTNILITYGGVTVPAKSFSLEINQNVEDDDFRLGSFFMGDMTGKQREITGSVSLRHEDNLTLRQALFGTSGATQVGGLTTKDEFIITCLSYENIPTTTTKFALELSLGQVVFEPFAFEPSGDDVLENDVAFRALRPDPSVPVMTAEVTNGREDIA